MSITISNTSINEISISKNPGLNKYYELMKRYGTNDAHLLLPQTPHHRVKFTLENTTSSFANGIRRCLIDEIPTDGLTFDDKSFSSDDEFILKEVLVKNINLIQCKQDAHEFHISLYKYNDTSDVIDVKASDLKITHTARATDEKKSNTTDDLNQIPITELVPNPNFNIISLRPTKFVKINTIYVINGKNKDDAGCFSLLANVSYEPVDIIPYKPDGTGQRSISHDCKKFNLSYDTTGNISPYMVMNKCCDELITRSEKCRESLYEYNKSDLSKKFYDMHGLKVKIINGNHEYHFKGEYITLAYMFAHKCFELDKNILRAVPTVERYDNEVGIIKIIHADPTKILIDSITSIIADVKKLKTSIAAVKLTHYEFPVYNTKNDKKGFTTIGAGSVSVGEKKVMDIFEESVRLFNTPNTES